MIRLDQAHVEWRTLSTVFLTHLHADHTFGLPDVFLTGWIFGRTAAFAVSGPSGTKSMFNSMMNALDVDIASRVALYGPPPNFQIEEINPGVVFDNDGLKVTAFPVDHVVTPTFGYRIDYSGHAVVLSGDTRYSESVIRNAKGADVLVHEIVIAPTNPTPQQQFVINVHTRPEDAAKVFDSARPRLAVYSHVVALLGTSENDAMAVTRATYKGHVVMGKDLMEIDVATASVVKGQSGGHR